MKLLLLLLFLIALQLPATAQRDSAYQDVGLSDLLLKKSKKQKTAAFILLGGGTTLLIIGSAVAVGESLDGILSSNNRKNGGAGEALAITGGAAMLGSIPLFIAAGRNKKKSLLLSFKNEKLLQLNGNNLSMRIIPALSLRLAL